MSTASTLKAQKSLERPKLVIIGSRGIPGRYGGTETFVYVLSSELKRFFDVFVTCETGRFYIDDFEGIGRIHVWAFHTPTITIPSIYDIISTLYVLKKLRDARLFFYVAPDGALAALLAKLARRKIVISTDGIEWKRLLRRAKYVPLYLKPLYLLTALHMLLMEFLACRVADVVIADAIGIKMHLRRLWRPRNIVYIAYGTRYLPEVSRDREAEILKKYGLEPYSYHLTVGRIVAENGIHIEIEALKKTHSRKRLVIVGPLDPRDPYVKFLFGLKGNDSRIVFAGGVYDPEVLYTLRKNCFAYIHAYEVGGTNPSLLEQLQFNRPIIARDVPFHREILLDKGIYFKASDELAEIIRMLEEAGARGEDTTQHYAIPRRYTWKYVTLNYAKTFLGLLKQKPSPLKEEKDCYPRAEDDC